MSEPVIRVEPSPLIAAPAPSAPLSLKTETQYVYGAPPPASPIVQIGRMADKSE